VFDGEQYITTPITAVAGARLSAFSALSHTFHITRSESGVKVQVKDLAVLSWLGTVDTKDILGAGDIIAIHSHCAGNCP